MAKIFPSAVISKASKNSAVIQDMIPYVLARKFKRRSKTKPTYGD